MIDASMIPDEVAEMRAQSAYEARGVGLWQDAPDRSKEHFRSEARKEITAALAAWPNATKDELEPGDEPFLILPLLKDAADE